VPPSSGFMSDARSSSVTGCNKAIPIGESQSASKNITELEAPLEFKVSEYIGNLRVLFIPLLDTAGTGSMGATIERQFISMFTESLCAIDESSPSWLGRFSDKPSITDSGLWNVRNVGSEYDLRFIPLLDGLLRRNFFRQAVLEN
jgi:hypothetical protein